MPSIVTIGTSLPSHRYSLQDMDAVGAAWLGDTPSEQAIFKRFLESSKMENRQYVLPAKEVLKIGGLSERNAHFQKFGPQLGEESFRNAVQDRKLDINTLIFTSCSCPAIPSIDAVIMERVTLPRTSLRIPIFQQGCAGGVVGLQLAAALSKSRGPVALTSVELCSLVFQGRNPNRAQIVGAAIFADGSATAVVSPDDRGLTLRASQSFLIQNSRHLMGYDLLDDGFHLLLEREIPAILAEYTKPVVSEFLANQGLKTSDIKHWLFHPGGVKILEMLEVGLGLTREQTWPAWHVLSKIGNLSSATVLFVLKEFLAATKLANGDRAMMVGVGPGLTLELILFEWVHGS